MHLGDVPGNPFYDAAVHTMSQSWHAFWFGALDPSGGVSVDKPPVDLWAQVASVKLLGFNPTALKLPQALAGAASVALVYDFVRRPFGRGAGLAAAAALAVLPVAVMTARSDTMDTLLGLLLLATAWLILRAAETGRLAWLIGAGAVFGLAFNVKLFQALVPLPAFALLWFIGSSLPLRRRLVGGLAAAVVALVVGFAWIVPVAATPSAQRPYPIGSTNDSIWNLVFVFNGLDRLHGRPLSTPDTFPAGTKLPPAVARAQRARVSRLVAGGNPLRLLDHRYRNRIGPELVPAAVAALAALLALAGSIPAARRRTESRAGGRLRVAAGACLATWLITGLALFSLSATFHPRYFETIGVALAAVLGAALCGLVLAPQAWQRALAALVVAASAFYAAAIAPTVAGAAGVAIALGAGALVLLAANALIPRVPGIRVAATVIALGAVLGVPAYASWIVVHDRAFDAESSGRMPPGWPPAIDRYLSAHRDGTRYSFASIAPAKAAPLIAYRPQPVLMLTSYRSRPLISARGLARAVRAHEVRYFLIGRRCHSSLTRQTAVCPPAARWAIAHSVDVTKRAGIGTRGLLYRVRQRL